MIWSRHSKSKYSFPWEAQAPARQKPTAAGAEKLELPLRLRRNRKADWARRLVRENVLTSNDLIWPIFICEGENRREPIDSMPLVDRLSIDAAVRAAVEAVELGIPAIALFPYTDPSLRDETGSEALNPHNLVCRACRAIKKEAPQLGLVTDVALDPYTSHGHDGVLRGEEILNDETVLILVQQALNQARAGADMIAPSDMMDGRVRAIRAGLDAEGFESVQILGLCREICFGLLWAFPGCGRNQRHADWRQAHLSDGSRQFR